MNPNPACHEGSDHVAESSLSDLHQDDDRPADDEEEAVQVSGDILGRLTKKYEEGLLVLIFIEEKRITLTSYYILSSLPTRCLSC